jgi:hypothetical protein
MLKEGFQMAGKMFVQWRETVGRDLRINPNVGLRRESEETNFLLRRIVDKELIDL